MVELLLLYVRQPRLPGFQLVAIHDFCAAELAYTGRDLMLQAVAAILISGARVDGRLNLRKSSLAAILKIPSATLIR